MPATPEQAEAPPGRAALPWRRRIALWLFALVVGAVGLIAVGLALLNSDYGRGLIAEQIAEVAPASGLRFEVARIDGDIYRGARLHGVEVSDPKGVFLTLPLVELDWRPLSWLTSGLDVRRLESFGGILYRTPELLESDPDAPILPDFDIRVDRLSVSDLRIAKGVAGHTSPFVQLLAKADIRSGRAFIEADGRFGSRDHFIANLDAQPDKDVFDIAADYQAPKDGVLAGLLGLDAGYDARVEGKGGWSQWDGTLTMRRDAARFGAFELSNRSGLYRIAGQLDPSGLVEGLVARALGREVSLVAEGKLADSVVEGDLSLIGEGVRLRGDGAVDLANNRVSAVDFAARLLDPNLFSQTLTLDGASMEGRLDGGFRDLAIRHDVTVERLVSGNFTLTQIAQQGLARYDGKRLTLPLDAKVARIVSGNAMADERLVGGTVGGTLLVDGLLLTSDQLDIRFPGVGGQLAFRGDLGKGAYALAGPASLSDFPIENIGIASGTGKIRFSIASGVPWKLRANFDARIPRVTNATIANLAGPDIRLSGGASYGGAEPLVFNGVQVNAAKLAMTLDGRLVGGQTSLVGRGRQADYGPFTVSGTMADDGPRAVMVFADPFPSAGLKNVRVAIAPSRNGFLLDASGQSMLGRFDGDLDLLAPAGKPVTINIARLDVWDTRVTGKLALATGGANGALLLEGGGFDGRIGLAARGGGQGFVVEIAANNASFGGETPLQIAEGVIDARGYIKGRTSTIDGTASGQGITYGSLYFAQFTADAAMENGTGRVNAAMRGRRDDRFALQLQADVAPSRYAVAARGSYAGRPISMPRRAVILATRGGGYRLEPAQVSFGGGAFIASGEFGGPRTALKVQMDEAPLSLLDLAVSDLGFGGTASGVVDYRADGTGSAKLKINSLSRSGLTLTSRPVNLALVAELMRDRLEARAVIDEDGKRAGRLQARITNLPRQGGLVSRLQGGALTAQLRYAGQAEALWRLAAIDTIDMTGPVAIGANISGTLQNPLFRGTVRSDRLRLRSVLSGTDIRDLKVRGTFSGPRLRIASFAGVTPGGGTLSGSGTFDLTNLGPRGPQMDLRIAARKADLLDAVGLKARVTGPMRIVSDGVGGTIAGRLTVERASWQFGEATASASLPQVKTREINLPYDRRSTSRSRAPWRYLIDARAPSRIMVRGMGIDSEWRGDFRVRGTTEDPRIGGVAQVVRGTYSFSGTRFDLTRGRITFNENVAINPRLDIRAETEADGLDVFVTVSGYGYEPQIEFGSNPALPTEEILARLLFGGSITSLSATDALQLGAAIASLNGNGGLDPINKLRTAIGLDRLRIVSADPALGRQTGIALGKNIGRKFYTEIITDGRGYSATQAEFRVTSWLSLLGSISTIGRASVVAEVSKDY